MLTGLIYLVLITVVAYLLVRWFINKLELILIARKVRAGNVALARVKNATLLGEARDICFLTHRLGSFEVEVLGPEGELARGTIIEDIAMTPKLKLPVYVYVTWPADGASQSFDRAGIVPTMVLYGTPSLKERVRALEEKYHPNYVEVTRSRAGLTLKPFGK